MKVTITVKEVNPGFDRELADKKHGGAETEDNILYNWEDEFEISGDVKDFKIRNNAVYNLMLEEDGEEATYPIEGMMIADAHLADGAITSCSFSRSLVKDTKKTVGQDGNVHFFVFLKGNKDMVNPMTGIYIARKDFPEDLPIPDEEE